MRFSHAKAKINKRKILGASLRLLDILSTFLDYANGRQRNLLYERQVNVPPSAFLRPFITARGSVVPFVKSEGTLT